MGRSFGQWRVLDIPVVDGAEKTQARRLRESESVRSGVSVAGQRTDHDDDKCNERDQAGACSSLKTTHEGKKI